MSNNTTAEKPKSEWSKRECGRLWVSEGKINVWLNGPDKTIIKYVCFPNKFKSEKNHPDYRVYSDIESVPVTQPKSVSIQPKESDTKSQVKKGTVEESVSEDPSDDQHF